MFPIAKQYCVSLFGVIKITIDSTLMITKRKQTLMESPSLCLLDPQIANQQYCKFFFLISNIDNIEYLTKIECNGNINKQKYFSLMKAALI